MAFYKNEMGNVDCFVFGSESWSSSGTCRWTVCGVIPYYVGEEFIHELGQKFEQFRFLFSIIAGCSCSKNLDNFAGSFRTFG